jgi:hypothetical protein
LKPPWTTKTSPTIAWHCRQPCRARCTLQFRTLPPDSEEGDDETMRHTLAVARVVVVEGVVEGDQVRSEAQRHKLIRRHRLDLKR